VYPEVDLWKFGMLAKRTQFSVPISLVSVILPTRFGKFTDIHHFDFVV